MLGGNGDRARAPSFPVAEVELQDISLDAGRGDHSRFGRGGQGNAYAALDEDGAGAGNGGLLAGDQLASQTAGAGGGPAPGEFSGCLGKVRQLFYVAGPPWVKNIVLCESCERFGYYGLRAVLVLYLNEGLGFSEAASVSLFRYASCHQWV